ncbi:galectin-3b isoform X2 [Trachinotus anak]|uniref:galectin-3b isoform X2 n=1 Tax=Trachinotus anak TaxID=443729 RepID=UPI0039F24371
MDLSDALGDWPSGGNQSGGGGPWPGGGNQSGGGGPWPGQPNNPTWPGQPPANPTWPGPPPGLSADGGAWPGGNPSQPTWPSPSPQPAGPGGWPSPSPGPGPGPGPGPTHPTAPQQSLAVPYQQNLPSGIYDKLLITITGTIKPNADKFTVDLRTANDLAFHFNPRFNESGRKVIVRNSCIGKKWGKEERDLQHFPFVQGQPFEMKILCTNREFKVAINNSHLLEFKHRITDLRSINRLNIYYDLNLSKVHMETLP